MRPCIVKNAGSFFVGKKEEILSTSLVFKPILEQIANAFTNEIFEKNTEKKKEKSHD